MGSGSSVHRVSAEALTKGLDCDPRICAVTAEETIETVGLAFCGSQEQHYLHWILGPQHAATDSPERLGLCKYNGKYAFSSCSKKGTVLGLRDPASNEVLGVMLLRRQPESDWEMMKTMAAAGSPPHMKSAVYGKEPLKRDEAIVKAMKQLAHKGPQYILYMLAVKPQHQGKGCAAALVRALFALSDRDGVPCCLDSTGARLEKFFAHLGFEQQKKLEVADPTSQEGSGPVTMVSMVRKPLFPA